MTDITEIKNLSTDIWKSCRDFNIIRPTRKSTEPFDDRLSKIDIKEFIVYNFIHHHGTALRELLLATFKFWENLTYLDWLDIFKRLKGKDPMEYYMAIFASQYLGLDPKFRSTKKVEIYFVTTEDGMVQSGKPSIFVGNMQDLLKQCEEEELIERYGLSIDKFISLSNRLNNEKQNVSSRQSLLHRFFKAN